MLWKSSCAADVVDPGVTGELGVLCGAVNVKALIGIAQGQEMNLGYVFGLPGCLLMARPNLIPASPGVYFITEGWSLEYVGSALNLKNRMAWHRTYGQYANGAWLRWIPFSREMEQEMRILEYLSIFQLCPKRNVMGNPESPNPYSGAIRSALDPPTRQRASASSADHPKTEFDELFNGEGDRLCK